MIADAHCHAWEKWPYDIKVPDADHRGSIQALLYEMDTHEVEFSAVVCARIGGHQGGEGHANPDNNEYVSEFAKAHPDRFTAWVDVDCIWRPEHHSLGVIDRFTQILHKNNPSGFTHYFGGTNDGWLRSEEGIEFFELAADRGLIASLAVGQNWFDDLSIVAQHNPTLPILIHHMSMPAKSANDYESEDLAALEKLSVNKNIGIKISGFNYNSKKYWDYPYVDSHKLFEKIVQYFGTARLYWGSDFPASRDQITYTQAIEVLRSESTFLEKGEIDSILGLNLRKILKNPKITH
jgi:predicted TIM-barrel fold metal-dependent hydrolase